MILVVDDEHALADTLALILERAGYQSTAAYSASEALMAVEKQRPDLIISDVMMPVMNGVDFAVKVSKLHLGIKVLLISGHAGTQDMIEAARSDGLSLDLLAKPVLPEDLLARVADILDSI
jgi:CheY-like chemotaxis protein